MVRHKTQLSPTPSLLPSEAFEGGVCSVDWGDAPLPPTPTLEQTAWPRSGTGEGGAVVDGVGEFPTAWPLAGIGVEVGPGPGDEVKVEVPTRAPQKRRRRAPSPTVYPCEVKGCTSIFQNKKHLQRHMATHHSDEHVKPACPMCHKQFPSQDNLDRHLKLQSCQSIICGECGKSILMGRWRVHQRMHARKKSKKRKSQAEKLAGGKEILALTYICPDPDCGERFTTSEELKQHKAKVHMEVYACGECGKSFSQRRYLAAHIKKVHAEKQFQCQYCDRCFSTKFILERHQKKGACLDPYKRRRKRGEYTKCVLKRVAGVRGKKVEVGKEAAEEKQEEEQEQEHEQEQEEEEEELEEGAVYNSEGEDGLPFNAEYEGEGGWSEGEGVGMEGIDEMDEVSFYDDSPPSSLSSPREGRTFEIVMEQPQFCPSPPLITCTDQSYPHLTE